MNHTTTVLCATLLLAALLPGPVAAHANYVSSTPAPDTVFPYNSTPSSVSVTLSETVEPATGTIQVTNETGAHFEIPPVTLSGAGRTISIALNASGPGIFTVAWSALSAVDGHFTAGSFAYAVQKPDGSLTGTLPSGGATSRGAQVSPLEVGLRFVGFAGLAIALGAAVLGVFMWIPAGRDPDVAEQPEYRFGFQVLVNVARIGAFAFALALTGLFLLTDLLEGTGGAAAVVGSPYKISLVFSLGVSVVLFLVLSNAFLQARKDPPESCRQRLLTGVVLGLAAIGVGSVGTHAAASETSPILGTLADAAHIAGVSLWVGGLATILATRSFLREPAAVPLARIVLGRFSRMAFYAVGMVLVGGLVLAILLVGTVDTLLTSGYGWVVLAKISLFAPMVIFGAYNRFRLIPKTAEASEPAEAVRRLTWNVRNETILGVTVLSLAALLASLPTATVLAQGGGLFELDATVSGVRVQMTVVPTPTAPTQYTLQFYLWWASNNTPYVFGRNGTMTFMLENSTPLIRQVVTLEGHGNHFVNVTTAMSKAGLWRIDASFQRVNDFDLIATFHISLKGGT